MLTLVAQQIIEKQSNGKIFKVAIDGVDGAGKSFFAAELATILREYGASVIEASVDGFHNPKSIRLRLGVRSPSGFYHDSYNYAALKEVLLEPLSPRGNRQYRRAIFDHQTDSPVNSVLEQAKPGSILVFDGIFLHRSELRDYWDYSIFLKLPFELSVPRGNARFGTSPNPLDASNTRYVEGQKLYLSDCQPESLASVVIDNSELERPLILKRVSNESTK